MDGTTVGYKYFDFDGISKVSLTARGSKSVICIYADEVKLAEIETADSGIWKDYQCELKSVSGVHALNFKFKTKGKADFIGIELG